MKTLLKAEEVIVGNVDAINALRDLMTYHVYASQMEKLGIKSWPRGLLLHGPPGTGKKSMVRAVAEECGVHLTEIKCCNLTYLHSILGDHGKEFLEKSVASSSANPDMPSVIFIDEIQGLFSGGDQSILLVRLLKKLISSKFSTDSSTCAPQFLLVASTSKVIAIEPALKSKCFNAVVEVTPPDEDECLRILELYTKKIRVTSNEDLQFIASSCNGYVGADLEDLCREAIDFAIGRFSDANNNADELSITLEDWKHALCAVQPSITRDVAVKIPKVAWDDIGGLKDLKGKLQEHVDLRNKHFALCLNRGISLPYGILLHGPPGCSKTMLAKAAACHSQASFFPLRCDKLSLMDGGEGVSLLSNTFQRARLKAFSMFSIVFLDEVDAVAMKRERSSSVQKLLLWNLVSELERLKEDKVEGILVLAATNHPQEIDSALMNCGRFDLVLYVPPPDIEARYEILCIHTRKMKLRDDVDLLKIAENTENFSGADLERLCMEAGIAAVGENPSEPVVSGAHFQKFNIRPSVTKAEVEIHTAFRKWKWYD